MNQNQINQVQGYVYSYFKLDMASLLNESFPEYKDNEVCIKQYTPAEFLSLSNKVFNQFRVELKTSFFKSLPFQYQFNNEFGGNDLVADLTNFITHSEGGNFGHAIDNLARLIHYQAVNGFWEKTKRKHFRYSEETLKKEGERIELVSKKLKSAQSNYEEQLLDLDTTKDELKQFTKLKQKELSEIESLLSASRKNHDEIIELYSKSTSLNEKILAIHVIIEKAEKQINIIEKDADNELRNISEVFKEQSQKLWRLSESFDKKLNLIDSKVSYFDERNGYLDDLIGREVGASLFQTFNQRKDELNSKIKFMIGAIVITAIIALVCIYILFGNVDLNTISWKTLFVNSLKAMPAIGLLLFSISQYAKERNFQEEYAFKSAVALTVNAYADQLYKDENKDILIMNSVTEIYKTPVSNKFTKEMDSQPFVEATKNLKVATNSLVGEKSK